MSDGFQISIDPELKRLDDFINSVGEEMGATALAKIGLDILSDVSLNSPVDTGLFRGNWRLSRNTRNRSLEKPDPAGRGVVSRGNSVVRHLKSQDTLYIENNVEYAAIADKQAGGLLVSAVRRVVNAT